MWVKKSRPLKGSSMISILGLTAKARASSARRCIPPELVWVKIFKPLKLYHLDIFKDFLIFFLLVFHVTLAEFNILPDRHPWQKSAVLKDENIIRTWS